MPNHLPSIHRFSLLKKIGLLHLLVLPLALEFLSNPALGQEQPRQRLIRERQVSSGYFEDVDVSSPFYVPLVGGPKAGRRYINIPPRSGTYRLWRTFLADSHYGIRILKLQKCQDCHPQQSRDNHTVRAKITCFQCHGNRTDSWHGPLLFSNERYSASFLCMRQVPRRRQQLLCNLRSSFAEPGGRGYPRIVSDAFLRIFDHRSRCRRGPLPSSCRHFVMGLARLSNQSDASR